MPTYAQRFKSTKERFWEKIDRTAGPQSCWPYTEALRKKNSYGAFWINGKIVNAHRVAWELSRGPIPNGLQCLHECDHKWCCNPRHLFLGTHQDNMDDKVEKGRQAKGPAHSAIRRKTAPRGERHPHHKLSEKDVRTAKRMRQRGAILRELSERFGVTLQAIHYAVTGKNWAHIT